MTQKQQTLINCLNKLVRQYFLYHEDVGEDPVRVRLRNDLHRVEQLSQSEAEEKLMQRLANNQIGLLHPQHKPYKPVSGWPILNLDDLVLNAMAPRLDPKVWPALRSHFEKTEIKRATETTTYKELLNDFTILHQYPTCGFHLIKTHLTESEARIQSVKAGNNFEKHFERALDERLKRETKIPESVQRINTDPDLVLGMERVRKDMLLFLKTLKELLEKLLQVKVRHLKSHVPINLSVLGTDKHTPRAAAPGSQGPSKTPPPVRLQQFQGNPPIQHNFKEQIMMERPKHWPVKVTSQRGGRSYGSSRASTCGAAALLSSEKVSDLRTPKSAGTAASFNNKRRPTLNRVGSVSGRTSLRTSVRTSESHSAGSEECSGVSSGLRRHTTIDQEMVDRFRKLWPPVWMSMASLEQGNYVVDPACPTKEYNQCLSHPIMRKHKSFSVVLETRRDWADMRKRITRTLQENLWREDQEKLDFFHVAYASLADAPLSKPYLIHERQLEELLKKTRRQRQKTVIYDCELSEWYKYLVDRVQEEVGTNDREINTLLESIKMYFKMSASWPKLGKAKLALITSSLPAFVVCQVHVQRALTFILTQVLKAPSPLLTGWLTARGLPFVLIKSHVI